LASHRGLDAVRADQCDAAVQTAVRVVHGDAVVILLDALHAGRRDHLHPVGGLRAFEQRPVHVRAVDHRVGVAEARTEGSTGGDAADERLVDGVMHHHLVGVHRTAASQLADAQRVERREGVRPELDAGTDLPELGRLFQNLDRESTARQRQCRCNTANPASGDQYGLRLVRRRVHGGLQWLDSKLIVSVLMISVGIE
jgi:hypothetical protein